VNHKIIKVDYEPAMTFEEIAVAMGTNKQTIWVIYARALYKIRKALNHKPALREAICGLARMKEEGRNSQTFPDWSE
jgi:predicted DNA-binding protein (UPF0251 family)